MSSRSIGKGAAVAALALTLFACGEGSNYRDEPREIGPVPVPESPPRDEPVTNDPYGKDDPYSKDTTPGTEPGSQTKTPTEPAPDALPKTPSTGDPPLPDDTNAATAHREFQDAMNARLKKLDERFNEFAVKVKDASEDARAGLQKSFDELSVKRDEAATKLDEIRSIAAEKWNTASTELEKAVSDLEDSIERALK